MWRLLKAMTAGVLLMTASHVCATARSGGTTLDRPSSARASALGDALSARDNDISAFDFNPAALSSLKEKQVSLFFERSAEAGGFGKFVYGTSSGNNGFGASLGYFSSGSVEVYEEDRVSDLEGQQDVTLALGAGHRIGQLHLGVTGKYLQSTLLETEKGKALAVDMGLQQQLSSRIRVGFSLLNFGSDLKFGQNGDPLSRQARLGALALSKSSIFPMGLQLETSYFFVERQFQLGAGLEAFVGPLALRAGVKSFEGESELGVGTGFAVGNLGLDYAFVMGAYSETHHQISVLLKFDGKSTSNE